MTARYGPTRASAGGRGKLNAWLWPLAGAAVVIAGAHLFDRWAYEHLLNTIPRRDTYQQLRQLGSVLPWTAVAIVWFLMVTERGDTVFGRRSASRPLLLLSAVYLAGGLAELIKPFIGRWRPENVWPVVNAPQGTPVTTDPAVTYKFFSFSQALHDWSDCGIPSSHSAVVFAAACAIGAVSPRAGWAVAFLGIGTSLTRVVSGNHYVSDVVAGAVVGWLVVRVLRRTSMFRDVGREAGPRVSGGGAAGGGAR